MSNQQSYFEAQPFETESEVRRRSSRSSPASRGRPAFGSHRRPSNRFRIPPFSRPRWVPSGLPLAYPYPPQSEPPRSTPEPGGSGAPTPASEPIEQGSEYIRWVQSTLNRVLDLRLSVNGIMGPETRSAIRDFQRRKGLPVDGIVGPPTEAALRAGSQEGWPQAPGAPSEQEFEWEALEEREWWKRVFGFGQNGNAQLKDIVINPPSRPGSYGKPSRSTKQTMDPTRHRCSDGVARPCPDLPGLEEVLQVSGIGFEYIGGFTKNGKEQPGIIFSTSQGKWIVVEKNRLKPRVQKMLPRTGDGLANFLASMKAINLPVEAILTMGSLNCRCISGTTTLSNHSFGDAIDIGGLRFVGGREVLARNSGDPSDRKLLHRVNACLRLSFATVLDYHDLKRHKDHFHCDTNIQNRGERRWSVAWPFVRESLGLPTHGKFDKPLANALRQFAGADAVKDRPNLDRTLSKLFMREAMRT